MPYFAFGSSICSTPPPSSSIRASVASTCWATPGSSPGSSIPQTPNRSPSRRSALGSSTPPGMPSEVESQGSRPWRWLKSSAASVTSRVSGPHWSSEEANAIIP
jgi:hypothetical protein